MLEAINIIINNTGVTFETAILIIFGLGGLIFFARDFKTGLVMLFFIFSGIFVWFYEAGYNYFNILAIVFIALVLLSFTLYYVSKSKTENMPI